MRKLTTEDFIIRARGVHGDKYDYSKVNYRTSDLKVCIICPEHGEFWQVPQAHFRGQGCPKCSGKNQDTSDFIKKAQEIHGDRYDYSKVAYLSAKRKVCVICRIHGEFLVTPNNHLSGKGCPFCAGNIRLTNDEFIKKAKRIHGDKYDYSNVVYKSAQEKICIVCPEHGEFYQTPNSHLSGQGCPICGGSFPLDKDSFINKARKVHGFKYDYSNINYVNNRTKVGIICPIHGVFWQTPGSHLQGCGCPLCADKSRGSSLRSSSDEFINKARQIYGDKYDYSKVEYVNKDTKVCIICPDHGAFWQTPGHHLAGHQCPACSGVPRITTEQFISEAKLIHGDLYDYSRSCYINAKTPIEIICKIHGIFRQIPELHLSGCGCPSCICSQLENEIYLMLKQNNIVFERQKGFPWLKDKKSLKLDYYLPEYNAAIECQGVQHFEPIDYFGGKKSYESNVLRDQMKLELCRAHNITVFYYSKMGIEYPYLVYEDKDELLQAIIRCSTSRDVGK